MSYPDIWLCVDTAEHGDFSGAFCLLGRDGQRVPFHSIMEMVAAVERIMDEEEASGARRRALAEMPSPLRDTRENGGAWTGSLGTFVITPMYRQHCSWQGRVRWLEGRRTECYRSVLELYSLLSSALRNGGEAGETSPRLRRMTGHAARSRGAAELAEGC